MNQDGRRHNQRAWDQRVREKKLYARPATDEDFLKPLEVIDECWWLGGDVAGKKVLCLGAGGGRHGPLLAAAGAIVTVVDLSARMLDLDRQVARKRSLTLETVETSMEDLSMLPESVYQIVIQPVSTCYVSDVIRVYREIARVTAAGGLYMSQHKQPGSLQSGTTMTGQGYLVVEPYYRDGPLPAVPEGSLHRESDMVEYLHRWEQLVGGMCQSGFVIEDLIEPRHLQTRPDPGTFAHRCSFLPPFVTIKARRTGATASAGGSALIWTP